jgi:plastocyanin
MKNTGKSIIVVAALLLFTTGAFGQEAKQEMKPEAARTVKSEATPTSDVKQAAEPDQKRATGKEKRVVATVEADGVQRVEVTGGEYYFDPNYIIVKVNVPVEFVVKKAPGYVPPDMVVKAPDAGIDFVVDLKKEAQTVKFTPTKIGKYEMNCDKKLLFFKSHKDRGMHGMIEVVE